MSLPGSTRSGPGPFKQTENQKQNNTMKTAASILLALGMSAAIAGAHGKGGKGGPKGPGGERGLPPEVLAEYDTDGDGVLSDTEKAAMKAAMEAKRAEFIAKYDTDGDGVLNAEERAAAQAAMEAAKLAEQKAKFAALDTDSSGGLSAAEWAAGAPEDATDEQVAAAFAKKDADADDSISLEEFTARPARPAKPAAKTATPATAGSAVKKKR